MQQKTVIRYSLGFKQQVVEQLESGRFGNIEEAKDHYGIKGSDTIIRWLRKYGRNHLCPKVVIVQRPDEKDQIKQLKKQIKQLKEALGQTQAENLIHREFLNIACEQLGQEVEAFKKKADTELFTGQNEDQD